MSEPEGQSNPTVPHAHPWIFPWRRSFRRRWSLLLAALIVLPIMALLLTTVRVRVFPPPLSLNRTAELVMVPTTYDNREWLEKIVQRTPFPDAGRERAIESLSDAWLHDELSPAFQPGQILRSVNLPDTKPIFESNALLPPLPLAEPIPNVSPVETTKLLQPRLRWLSPLKADQLPQQWPDYAGPINDAAGLKYMLEVNRDGLVLSCVPAGKESDKRVVALENWLKRVRFPESKQALGWLACEIIWQYDHD